MKMNIALDGCLGFLLGANPHLVSDDSRLCEAIQEHMDKCIDWHLPR